MHLKYTPSEIDRFWSFVDMSDIDGCWPWTGYRDKDGYGKFTYRKYSRPAHRIAYGISREDIPAGFFCCHSCDNPPCCNPDHLWIGTPKDNVDDRHRKGRDACGDKSGSRTHRERMLRGENHPLRRNPELAARGEKNGAYTHPEKVQRGDNHPHAKLTTQQVLTIRKMYEEGAPRRVIANKFNVSWSAIDSIIHRRSWVHI